MKPKSRPQNKKYQVDVLTGLRPTGNLTIANYLGAVKPLMGLQSQSQKTMVFVADMHGLTDTEPSIVSKNTKEIIIDYLALGLDSDKFNIFIQSSISTELLELTTYLLRHISVAELLRVPTLKDKIKNNQNPENASTLLAIYPVLMAADILIQRSHYIPIGEDQVPHMEVTKLLARRFNDKYGYTFPIPETQIIKPLKILGLRGSSKMSKSTPENAIFLIDSPEVVHGKIKTAETANPGEMTPSLESHFLVAYELSDSDDYKNMLTSLKEKHLRGEKVMSEFKALFEEIINSFLSKFQNRRNAILSNKEKINELLKKGNGFAKTNANKTLEVVKKSLSLNN